METAPHLEAPAQHVAGRLAVPGVSAAVGVNVHMGFGSGITAMSEELVETLQGQLEMAVNAGVCWECACGDVFGPGV